MSDKANKVPGYIEVNWNGDDRKLFLSVRHISAFWKRSCGKLSCVATGDDESPWCVRETVEEIAELIREANGGAK